MPTCRHGILPALAARTNLWPLAPSEFEGAVKRLGRVSRRNPRRPPFEVAQRAPARPRPLPSLGRSIRVHFRADGPVTLAARRRRGWPQVTLASKRHWLTMLRGSRGKQPEDRTQRHRRRLTAWRRSGGGFRIGLQQPWIRRPSRTARPRLHPLATNSVAEGMARVAVRWTTQALASQRVPRRRQMKT